MKLSIRDIQQLLAMAGFYTGGIDGHFGAQTTASIDAVLSKYNNLVPKGKISKSRRVIVAVQILLNKTGYDAGAVDGYFGANTKEAFNSWAYRSANGKPESIRTDNIDSTTTGIWPKYSQLESFYGKVGENQVKLKFPYTMKIAWNPKQHVNSASCHKKVVEPMQLIFQRTLQHYGMDNITKLRLDMYGGILNVRKMRGGSNWSTHSWGIACDLDPINNQLRWGAGKAEFSKTEYEPFWKIVESVGATSLGRSKNYDFMHFQFMQV